MKKYFLLLFFILPVVDAFSQQTITYMQYNLLNYGNLTSYCTTTNNDQDYKDGYLRTILDYIQPDILAVNEVGRSSANANRLLDEVLNENNYGVTYQRADITNNANSYIINVFFYNPEKVKLESQAVAQSVLRDINHYRLYAVNENLSKGDTTFLNCFVTHLKAGYDHEDEELRGTMTRNLMNYLEWNEIQEAVLFSGDMNFYSDSEEGVENLMEHPDDLVRFYDPVNKMGDWHNNSYYAQYHTQSTHADYNGCAASGGMDDRFDFVFINKSIRDGLHGVTYIDYSYKAVGNDGQHFNKSINDYPDNNSVPADVLNALYQNSDHLPVVMEMEMETEIGIAENDLTYPRIQVVNPAQDNIEVKVYSKEVMDYTVQIFDLTGRLAVQNSEKLNPGSTKLNLQKPDISGMYLVVIQFGNGKRIAERVLVF